MFMYTCVDTYTHACIDTYLHEDILNVLVNVHTHIHACIFVYTPVSMDLCIHTYIVTVVGTVSSSFMKVTHWNQSFE